MRQQLAAIVTLCLVLAGCAGTPAAPVDPTAPTAGATPTGQATASAPPAGSGGGTATVTVGSETYHLATDDADRCSLEFGVQASMHSADRRAGLDVFTTRVNVGAFIFSRLLDGEAWQPSDQPPARFEISATRATWTGPMRERESGREEQVTVDITCGG
jgi:hypothetical protein